MEQTLTLESEIMVKAQQFLCGREEVSKKSDATKAGAALAALSAGTFLPEHC